MQSTAKTVTGYLEEVPAERKAVLTALRDLCRRTLVDFEELMQYGGPCYSRNGVIEAGFASQKNFIGLYTLRTDVMNRYRDRLQGKGISLGKGVIRYARQDAMDFEVIEMMLKDTQGSTGVVC